MKNVLKRGLAGILAWMLVIGLLPTTAFAAVDSTGKPTDLKNTLVLSIYTPEGSFPGEPAMHGSDEYISFNSSFAKTSASGKFKDDATTELETSILNDLVQGASNGSNTVWGVFSADGLKEKYFKSNASIIQPANEAKIIRVIKGNAVQGMTDDQILKKYEIIWYVIKLQHSPASSWWGRATTEWHIDGLIKEKSDKLITINYYGNGNTEGSAPDGITNHVAGTDYSIAGSNMKKKINGVYVDFLGWSARADGTGEEAGFYQPGDVINPTENISLYAMWDTTTQYTATVNLYLDNALADDGDINGTERMLYLSTDNTHFYGLTRNSEGVYSTKITGNGKFHLYVQNADGTYTQIGSSQLTIYNQNGNLDVHQYSVSYDANGGDFADAPGNTNYFYGEAVSAIAETPTREGYRFLGWKTETSGLILPGEEVTASIAAPVTLTAQWEKTVNVTVNVTVNHVGGDGYDQAPQKANVELTVASKVDHDSPFLEIGEKLTLTSTAHSGFTYSVNGNVTKYEGYTLTDMPGGDAEYTVVTSKSGYETSVNHSKDADGDWIIDVVMTYKPSNFDLEFTIEVDDSVPDRYLPNAVIAKATFWASGKGVWEIITQQAGGEPGVRVDIDPATRSGSGSYPVWKYESNGELPYGYRIEVTSFVYPDGTIVPVSALQTDVKWSDNVYTATMDPVTGGQTYGTLGGAYYDKPTDSQKGTLNAVVTMDLHNVIFDAQGGKVNGQATQKLTEQFNIPAFKDHVPTREGGYIFDGWYQDRSFTKPAVEGADLTRDVTLYAKWIEPLTISGTISISGTYQQNGETVNVHDIDRATEAVVVLQELHNGTTVEIDSEVVTFGDYDASGSGNYSFTGIPNDGKSYQIHVLVLNYGTAYDNESDADSTYTATEYTAVFGGDTTADVDAHLQFVPPSYDQILNVNASAIGEGFRPTIVLSEVMYRDTGDNHAFQRISQHDVAPYGVPISLNAGIGRGTQSIWKWHTDGTLYDYQMNITKVDGVAYDSDTAPFYITYAKAAYWNVNTNSPSNELVATLIPNQYLITFDLNAGASAVEGMDAYKVQNTENNGQGVNPTANVYQTTHTWSFDTEITAVPVRDGYTFLGWTADVKDAYDNGKINASVYEDVVLTAQWEKNSYTVATVSNPANGGITTGDGIYQYGDKVILTAAAWDGYTFSGWYEGENLLTSDPEFTFFASADRTLTAHFAQNIYQVVAETTTGGTVSGTGNYGFGDTATLNATAEEGYMFRGWYEGNTMVAEDPTYTFTVTGDRTLTAKFVRMYTITAEAQTGGTTTGGGRYEPMTNVTITAEAKSDYNFIGWYDENDNLVTAEATYTLTVMEDRTFTAKFEEKKNYKCDYVYLFGYNDTKIGAEGPLLRGELAQMIYRLVKQNYPGTSNGGHAFGDTSGLWFQSGVSYMAEVGAIDSSKSNAYPYVAVTRGETYKLICLGLGFTDDTDLRPTQYAAILNNHGYDTPEGSVNSKIARYEFCELFNAILGRSNYCQDGYYDTKGNEVTAETYGYTDLDPSASYYRTMMIATSTFTNGKIDIEKRIQRNTYDFNN